jgi:MFS family permease
MSGVASNAGTAAGGRFSRLSDLHRLLINQAGTFLGDAMLIAAFPLLAVQVTRSPALVSAVAASATLPWLVVGLPSGVLADRWDRRRLMTGASLAACGLLVVLAVTVGAGLDSVVVLAVVAFGVGCMQVVAGNAGSAILPQVVSGGSLTAANAWLYAAQQVAGQLAGPPLAGVLISAALTAPVAAAASCYGLAAAVLMTWRRSFPAQSRPAPGQPLGRQLTAGFRFLAHQRQLLTFALLTAWLNLAWEAVLSVLVLYAVSPGPLCLSRAEYGFLLAALAVGGVGGAALAPQVAARIGRGHVFAAVLAVLAAGLALPALWPQPLATAAALAAMGAAGSLYNVTTVAYRQRITPPALLGRVTASYRLFAYGSLPLGAVTGGLVASQLSLRAVFPAAAGIVILAAFALPAITERSLASAEEAATGQTP